MNISKRKQGILAIICTIAMIVTSITVYNPREVKAADWSTVDTWKTVSAGDIDYKVQKDGSFINDGFHAEGGGSWVNATNVLYMNFLNADYTKAVINDVEYLSANHKEGTDECIRFGGAQVWISFDLFKFKKNTIVFYNGDNVLSSLYVYNPEGSDSDAPAPTAPVLNVTDFNATTNSFTFTWDDAENASYYDLYVGTTKVAGRVTSGVSKTYRELGLEQTSEDQTIEFILKAVNGTGETASAVVEKTLPKFSWKSIDGTDKYAYNSNTKVNVVNIQSKNENDSVYMNVTAGITSISVNGKTEAVGAIEGSGFWVYFSALTEEENEVVVYMGTESRTVIIKKLKDDSSDSSYTDGEVLVNESNQTKEVPAYTDGDYWQNEYNNMPVKYVKGKKYVAEVVVSSTAAKKIKMVFQRVNFWDFVDANQGYETSIAAGNKVKITYVFEATQKTDNGNFDIYLGSVADKTTLVFESKKLTTYNEVPAGVQTGVEVLEAPEATKYTVSIDGKEKPYEEGATINVPTEGQGYYDVDEKVAYAPGSEITVNENMTLKSIELNVTMTPGASIRLAAPTGLRFQTTVTSGNGIAADEILNSKTVTTGTLITTLDLYKANGKTLTKDSKYTFLDIANAGWFGEESKKETGKFCGSIIKIQRENYGRKFIAVGYATINYSNGKSKTVYANVTENNAKSIKGVAEKIQGSAAYNKYTPAQQGVIDKYINGEEISE